MSGCHYHRSTHNVIKISVVSTQGVRQVIKIMALETLSIKNCSEEASVFMHDRFINRNRAFLHYGHSQSWILKRCDSLLVFDWRFNYVLIKYLSLGLNFSPSKSINNAIQYIAFSYIYASVYFFTISLSCSNPNTEKISYAFHNSIIEQKFETLINSLKNSM